jgi:hypothetical protein
MIKKPASFGSPVFYWILILVECAEVPTQQYIAALKPVGGTTAFIYQLL